jgi:hypothetical protein
MNLCPNKNIKDILSINGITTQRYDVTIESMIAIPIDIPIKCRILSSATLFFIIVTGIQLTPLVA